jgi:hypothetical protein
VEKDVLKLTRNANAPLPMNHQVPFFPYSQRNNSANRSFSLSDARQKKRLRKVKGKDRQLDSDDEDIEEGQAPLPPSSIEV